MVEDGTEFGFQASQKRDNWVTRQGRAVAKGWTVRSRFATGYKSGKRNRRDLRSATNEAREWQFGNAFCVANLGFELVGSRGPMFQDLPLALPREKEKRITDLDSATNHRNGNGRSSWSYRSAIATCNGRE